MPFLTANNLVNTATSIVAGDDRLSRRVQGGRTDDYMTNWQQYALGVDGKAWGWDYNARLTVRDQRRDRHAAGGYTDYNGFANAR